MPMNPAEREFVAQSAGQTAARLVVSFNVQMFRVLEPCATVLMGILVVLVGIQVVSRYVLNAPVAWTEEAARIAFVWIAMLGCAITMERREHYEIRFVVDSLSGWSRLLLTCATQLLSVVFIGIFVWLSVVYVSGGSGGVYIATGLPRTYVYLALPVGIGCLGISMVAGWLKRGENMKDDRPALPLVD